MADASTQSSDQAGMAAIISLLLQAMKGQQGGGTQDIGTQANSANGTASQSQTAAKTIPSGNASDQSLMDWYSSNQGKTVYGPNGDARTIPVMSSAATQGGVYGNGSGGTPGYGSGSGLGAIEPGMIRLWINNKNGILNGASFENPLIAQAEQMLKDYKATPAANANSTLTPPAAPAPAAAETPPAAPTYTPVASSNPFASGLPAVPATTVPANNPALVTDMISGNANQALTNPNLTASSGLSSGTRTTDGSNPFSNSIFARLSSGTYRAPMSMANAAQYQTPGGVTMDLGSVNQVPAMGLNGANYAAGGLDALSGANAAPLSTGGANYATGGLDSGSGSSGFAASGGAPSVGDVSGGGLSQKQMQGIGSSVGALISSVGKMFTPGVVGIPSLPSGVPLSQFRPAVMT